MLNLVFDVGGVILTWDPHALVEKFFPGCDDSLYDGFFEHPDWAFYDQGLLNREEIILSITKRTHLPPTQVAPLLESIPQSLKLKKDTIKLIEKLHAQGVPLHIISNMPKDIAQYLLEMHSIWSYFDHIIFSGDVKKVKPNADIFEHFLAQSELKAGDCLFIDDRMDNIRAAQALGFQSILFGTASQVENGLIKFYSHFSDM